MKRYHVVEGIIIRRTELPSGDVVVTLLSEEDKWRGVARKGKLIGGNVGRLSLFHDVTVQYYRKADEDLVLITQVQLNGALPGLTTPEVYPYAHVLAELADKLTGEAGVDKNIYSYLTSGLRGLSQHPDPEAVALIMGWKLLAQSGFSPRMSRCARCGGADIGDTFDVSAGGVTCTGCSSGFRVPSEAISELATLLRSTVREGLELPLAERNSLWTMLSRYIAFHVGEVQSVLNLSRYTQMVG